MDNFIKVVGARTHNLKNISVDIPKNKLVVFTGVSGSGKSSMAFDTIYAEGQRRYIESLSSYARQFLGVLEKPDVDLIEGLSPAISIDQRTTSKNPRSTVGTVTEIYDYLRLLYARVGHPHCPECGDEIKKQSLDEIVSSVFRLFEYLIIAKKFIRIVILSPVVVEKKGEFRELFANLRSKGYSQVRIDGIIKDTDTDMLLIKTNKHSISAVCDKLTIDKKGIKDKIYKENLRSRLTDAVSQALKLSDGLVTVSEILDKDLVIPKYPKNLIDHTFSERFACPKDNIQIPEMEPRLFSFNSPIGACAKCNGLGRIQMIDKNLLISSTLSILEGAILPFSNMFENDTWYSRLFKEVCLVHNINMNVPFSTLEKEKVEILFYGTGDKEYRVYGKNRFGRDTYIMETFLGVFAELDRRYKDTDSDWVRNEIEKYMTFVSCPECKGARLKKEALSVTIDGYSITELCNNSIEDIYKYSRKFLIDENILTIKEKEISKLILIEIIKRLEFLLSVGLSYLTLSRPSGTLSGGESQRIRLASQIGSGLTGVLYVLDEPTIGLHQKDNQMLIDTLKKLKDLGNSVIVVEHDETMMKQSDYIIDFGPGAGSEGGKIVSVGKYKEICSDKNSVTGAYLSGRKIVTYKNVHKMLNFDTQNYLRVTGCNLYNLKNIDVNFPLNKFVVVTGVSGSGKSTLLVETLYNILREKLATKKSVFSNYRSISGTEHCDKVILIDQSPIGKTPRSNPATYTKVFDEIRYQFSLTRDAKFQGVKKGAFSFNVKGGRCEACEGQGMLKIEMQFMSDIWVKCEVCQGMRYNAGTLDIHFRGKNIYDVLTMSVNEAIEFYNDHNKIMNKLQTLSNIGLGYIKLGQSATTLSGGESQRVKLASELSKKDTGNTVYILDEPTTGLHFADVEKLLAALKILVSKGNSVFIIEHNMDIIKNADWIIDMGPEGGDGGGKIVFEGTPSDIINSSLSYTGKYLKEVL